MQQRYGLQERLRATLTQTTSGHAGAGDTNGTVSKPVGHLGRVILPVLDTEEGNPCENTSCGYGRAGTDALYSR